jgi:uncharacterized protein (DUF697 family)
MLFHQGTTHRLRSQEGVNPVTETELKTAKIINKYVWISGAAGLIPIPFLDLAAVSGVQLKMLADIAKVYDVPFKKDVVKASIGALSGFVLPHAIACGFVGSMFKAVPVIGFVAGGTTMSALSGAYAWALGNVFVQHFESGGTFLDFNAEAVKEYFKAQFEEGKKKAPPTIDAPQKAQVVA